VYITEMVIYPYSAVRNVYFRYNLRRCVCDDHRENGF